MTEGFRPLRGERLLSATFIIDLNAMIFGGPRAVPSRPGPSAPVQRG